jgi:pimeloyl-ACP methyl ester carboxylesterase
MVVGMAHDIAALLDARTWRAFDIDDHGRVLAGSDELGSVQLVELDPDGSVTPLTALPGPCSGRYLPGERVVVVAHDDGGNERGQLSLLALDPMPDTPVGLDRLEPLAYDPEHVHRLIDVLPGHVVYATNRRNGVDFDVLIRAVGTVAEEVVYDHGGMVQAVGTSPEARHVVLTVPGEPALSDRLLLVDTMPPLAGLTFQPTRWAAGVDIVGISSLVTFLENTSAYRRAHREREYGSLEQDREFLEQASPLSRVDRIRAPLFVIHGANDPRVPLSEAEQLVDAVRSRGVECELLVYPDEGHGLARRANRQDAYPRALAFLARALTPG